MKKSRLYTALNASIAVFLGGVLLLGTGFWLYVPSEIEVLPETGDEVLGDTWTVCPDGIVAPEGCQYFGGNGIQQAVDAAHNGDTVLIKTGSYSRQSFTEYLSTTGKRRKAMLVIKDKNITLTGEGSDKTKLDGTASANMSGIVATGASQVTVKRMTIDGFKADNNDCLTNANSICSFGSGFIAYDTSRATITNNTISKNSSNGVYFDHTAQGSINDNNINSNSYGISGWGSTNIVISNNIIHTNSLKGLILGNLAKARVTNNTFVNTGIVGIEINHYGDSNPEVEIVNNIITGTKRNTDGTYGFGFGGDSINLPGKTENDVFKHNLVWGNEADNTSCTDREICADKDLYRVSSDPKFVSTTDYHLQPGSPAINAGDPSILDPDGSRSDIGAYGGPGACGLDPTLPSCVAKPKDLSVSCTNGTATFKWTGDASVPKYLLRVNHEPSNTKQCKHTSGAEVGWYCPVTSQCLSGKGCDDRYIYVTATGSVTHTVALKAGESYSWSVNNWVNNVEGTGTGDLVTNAFTCSGAGVTPPPTIPPSTSCKPMDVNSDGKFNISDLASFAQGYPNRTCIVDTRQQVPTCGWEDVNGDTKINIADFASFAQRYFTHHDSCAL